jgi:hypothetical protein
VVYEAQYVYMSTVRHWPIKYKEAGAGQAHFLDTLKGRRPIRASDETHQKLASELNKENLCITNGETSIKDVISKERLGHTNKFLGYRKVCVRMSP